MRFYEACIRVAEQVEAMLTPEQQEMFIETDYGELFLYYDTLGIWIQNQCLNTDAYLRQALLVLGCYNENSMALFLLESVQQYLKLKQAQLL